MGAVRWCGGRQGGDGCGRRWVRSRSAAHRCDVFLRAVVGDGFWAGHGRLDGCRMLSRCILGRTCTQLLGWRPLADPATISGVLCEAKGGVRGG